MPSFTLGTASQATGTAKSTILRAIRAGRISAARSETGEYQIDPAELARVFPLLAISRRARHRGERNTRIAVSGTRRTLDRTRRNHRHAGRGTARNPRRHAAGP
jgi:hypothetical protein